MRGTCPNNAYPGASRIMIWHLEWLTCLEPVPWLPLCLSLLIALASCKPSEEAIDFDAFMREVAWIKNPILRFLANIILAFRLLSMNLFFTFLVDSLVMVLPRLNQFISFHDFMICILGGCQCTYPLLISSHSCIMSVCDWCLIVGILLNTLLSLPFIFLIGWRLTVVGLWWVCELTLFQHNY